MKKTLHWIIVIFVGIAFLGGAIGEDSICKYLQPPFSQEKYDEAYFLAFQMNSTSRGYLCISGPDDSWRQGFEDGLSDFNKIYQHPNVGPFSYSLIDRQREVIQAIEQSTNLEPWRKAEILKQLKADLKAREASAATKGRG